MGINKERSIQTSTGNRIQKYRIFSVSREMRTNCGHKRQNLIDNKLIINLLSIKKIIRILQASSIIMGLRSGLGSCNTAIISRSSFNSCMILHMACGRSLNVRFCNSSIIALFKLDDLCYDRIVIFVYLYTSKRLSFRVFEQFEIDFSRRDMFMSQHFAYGVDISSIRQLQDCIGVAETVEYTRRSKQ